MPTPFPPSTYRVMRTATVGVLIAFAAGCSFKLTGEPCSGDSDCADQAICANGFCAATCSNDSDCQEPDRTCQPLVRSGSGDTENVCLVDTPEDVGVDGADSNACTTDDVCQDRLDDEQAVCGIGGTCIIRPDARFAILLVDTTDLMPLPADGAPGADIAAAFLAPDDDDQTEAVAWATSLLYDPIGDLSAASHLDGSALQLSEDGRCIEGPFASTTTPLGGLGGQILLRFVDRDGREVPITDGLAVHVIEWGPNCDASLTQVDQFEAYLCTTRTDSFDPTEDCRQRMGEGGGYQRFVPTLND